MKSQPITEIIIITYRNPEYEKETILQVLNTVDPEETPYHLTVYDNYERDENLSVVWNRTINRTDADYICLLNNDTVPQDGWLKNLLDGLGDAGAIGPLSNRAGGHQGGHERPLDIGVKECHMLSGFCLVFPKSAWRYVGGFDERFKLYGEDNDFCNRLKKAGYKLLTHYGVYVYHHKAQSTKIAEARGKDVTAIQKESAQLYQSTL